MPSHPLTASIGSQRSRRTRRLALAGIVAMTSLSLAAAAPPSAAAHRAHAAPPDPVGSYQWSLTMAEMNNTQVSGTLKVTRKDSTLTATVTSDHSDGEIAAKTVTFENNRLTVVSDGDFGEFTIAIDYKDDGMTGSFRFVDPSGQGSEGPLSISRADK